MLNYLEQFARLYVENYQVNLKDLQLLKYFLKQLPENSHEYNILDIGCGGGVQCHFMDQQGHKVIGHDLSIEMIKIAKEKYPHQVFLCGQLKDLNFQNKSFKGIFVSFSLITDPPYKWRSYVKKFKELLIKKGVIYLGLQGGENRPYRVKDPVTSNFTDESNVGTVTLYGHFASSIIKIFEAEGFRIIYHEERCHKTDEVPMRKIYLMFRLL